MLRAVSLSLSAGRQFSENVRLGQEPMFTGVEQRVIRLCGRGSGVTEVSLERYGRHVVPVFEEPAGVRELIREHSEGYRVPVYWQVSEGAYSDLASWSKFLISREFFLRTATARTLLYMEARYMTVI